jgi:hypothetical protein
MVLLKNGEYDSEETELMFPYPMGVVCTNIGGINRSSKNGFDISCPFAESMIVPLCHPQLVVGGMSNDNWMFCSELFCIFNVLDSKYMRFFISFEKVTVTLFIEPLLVKCIGKGTKGFDSTLSELDDHVIGKTLLAYEDMFKKEMETKTTSRVITKFVKYRLGLCHLDSLMGNPDSIFCDSICRLIW